ncbi:hypothetical protein A5708_23810 [Mycobacterium colombiense]|uniref:Uncharacterized protein n=1 Tax=Mycobacterium colombiense TaxID=339268 RepID=A0A1A2YWA4_9MYCO|nr:hypothetical protein A5708_23810 [Mycobacterium colombiense]
MLVTRRRIRGGIVVTPLRLIISSGVALRASRLSGRLAVVAVFLAACFATVTAIGAVRSDAKVGELGPPPDDSEIKQALIDLYQRGQPPDFTVDVQLLGPTIVGQPTVHPNPPPQPWCVRCAHPDPGASPMYPVLALVSVTTTQGLVSSALPPSSFVHTTTTTYDGKPCPGETNAQYCPTYFFYRDDGGNWQVA